MRMRNSFLTIIGIVTFQFSVLGQDCANTLAEAKDTYEQGLLEAVPQILEGCLNSDKGFSKSQKIEAYKLLTLTYLYDDKQGEADKSMLELLKLDPELEVNPAVDPIEFIELFNSYRTLPVYSFGLQAGSNFTIIDRIARYGVEPISTDLNSGDPNFSKYLDRFGFIGGLKANRYLSPRMELNLDIMFRANRFEFEGTKMLDFATVRSKESQSWLYMPLTVTYDFRDSKVKKKVWPYARLGIGTGIRLSAQTTMTRDYDQVDGVEVLQGGVSGPAVDLKDQRKAIYLWGVIGTGVKYKVKRGYLFADLRYNYGFLNAVNTTNRYSNPELIYEYYYVDDDFAMHGFNFTVGLVRSLYKPKKLDHSVKLKKKTKKKTEETEVDNE